jgi:hypothetical protein
MKRFMLKAEPVKLDHLVWNTGVSGFSMKREPDKDLRYSLFRNDLHMYKSKSYVLLPIQM